MNSKAKQQQPFFLKAVNIMRASGSFNSGNAQSISARENLLDIICMKSHYEFSEFPSYVGNKYFTYLKDQKVLKLGKSDKKILSKIKKSNNPFLCQNLLRLCQCYIIHNEAKIQECDLFAKRFTKELFDFDLVNRFACLNEASEEIQQSIFFIRSYFGAAGRDPKSCLLYTSPSPRDRG